MIWQMCRDAVEGESSIKGERRQNYLPKPDGMSDDEYNGYVTRAEFCPFAGRTLDGVHGLMFRKQVDVKVPKGTDKYIENVDGKGSPLGMFISDCSRDCMITGWGGFLVDAPSAENISQKQAEENEVFPYLVFYRAEQIINVQTKTVGRKRIISLVVLHEKHSKVSTSDEFTVEVKDMYRVLRLVDGVYFQTLYDKDMKIISNVPPKKAGKTMSYIPFYFAPGEKPSSPMFLPVIDVNLAWYRKSADLENGLHWTGVPTPYALGYTPETTVDDNGEIVAKNKLKLGGSQFLCFPEEVKSVGYLEFSGAGLSHIEGAMEKDETRMSILGAKIIAQEKKGVESAETARIGRASENSVVAAFANKMSDVFTAILRELIEWSSSDKVDLQECKVSISTDYDVSRMSPAELTALVSAWQSGGISAQILYDNLVEGELIRNKSFEDMQEEIAEEISKRNVGA